MPQGHHRKLLRHLTIHGGLQLHFERKSLILSIAILCWPVPHVDHPDRGYRLSTQAQCDGGTCSAFSTALMAIRSEVLRGISASSFFLSSLSLLWNSHVT